MKKDNEEIESTVPVAEESFCKILDSTFIERRSLTIEMEDSCDA